MYWGNSQYYWEKNKSENLVNVLKKKKLVEGTVKHKIAGLEKWLS